MADAQTVERMGWLALWILLPTLLLAGPAGPVTWRDTAFVGGGWGRMTQLGNGDWLCVTTEFPGEAPSFLRLHRSTDAARTWTDVTDVKETGRVLDNGELTTLSNGTVLLTLRSLIPEQSYRLPVYASTDGGSTWTYRSTIDGSEGLGGRGLWEPDFWVLHDGRLVVTYSNEKHPGHSQVISERISMDQGVSWSEERWAVFEPGGGDLRPGMSQMARMANGLYILVFELVGSGHADVHYKISADGTTWPDGLGTRIPCQHSGPFVTSLPNGMLLVTSCENEVSFSEDYGRTWQRTDPAAWDFGFLFSWPAIYVTGPHEIGVMSVPGGARIRFGTVSSRMSWPNPYREEFNRGIDRGWTRYGGAVGFADGHYLLSNEGSFGKAMAGDGFWMDGILEADVMLTSPGDAGVLFRTTNPDYTGPDDAFGYYAGLDTSGHVILGKMNNAWELLASAAHPVVTQTWYRLKVVLVGDEISVHVNDGHPPLITHTDDTFYRGQIGVRAFQCDARFDNVTYSNSVPLHLKATLSGDRLHISWPETSVATQLYAAPDVRYPQMGTVVSSPYVLSNRSWHVSLDEPREEGEVYWLEGR